MKTPDEIKKGLWCCSSEDESADCGSCPYNRGIDCSGRISELCADALALFQQLERERDAAVKDMRNAALCGCHVCKHYYRPDPNVRKYACKIHGSFEEHDFIADDGSIWCGAMQWRGVQKEVE